jgi:four helix bundle protein
LIRGLRPTIELLRRKSPRLRRQLEDSLAGIVQNVCEGSGRAGGDRPALYRYALGSLREVNGILLAAVAFGWLAEAPLAAQRDRLGGILFGLQRG